MKLRSTSMQRRGCVHTTLEAGNQVLLVRPMSSNKLLMQRKGPLKVKEKVGPTDYRVSIKGEEEVYHTNI